MTTEYFTDIDGGSVYVRIDNVEAKTEAMDVKLDDIEIKR